MHSACWVTWTCDESHNKTGGAGGRCRGVEHQPGSGRCCDTWMSCARKHGCMKVDDNNEGVNVRTCESHGVGDRCRRRVVGMQGCMEIVTIVKYPALCVPYRLVCASCSCTRQQAPPGSLQIHLTTAPTLWDKLSLWLSPPVLVSSVSCPYALVIFMMCYILFCKLFLTCFVPCLSDYCATCKHS